MKKGSFDFANFDLLSRSEMKNLMAGSDNYCTVTPCAWPEYTSCCCPDGSKTCVENDDGGSMVCWAFCGFS